MTDQQLYCDVADCDDPKNPGYPCPVFRNGKCSTHTKQIQRKGETKKIAEKLPLSERLIDAYAAHAEADGEEDWERTKRQFVSLAKSLGKEKVGEAISEGLARARANGKRIGSPPEVELDDLLRIFRASGSVTATARVLRLTKGAVSKRLRRGQPTVSKVTVWKQSCPRRTG